jgi:ABC-type bacteriocin/lantibiotic exporter with double-glycine peptidase domain
MKPTERFWKLIDFDKKDITQIYLYAIFNGLVNLTLPVGIQTIINFIQMGQVSASWILLVSFVLAGIAVSGILQILQLKIVEHLQQKIFARSAFEFSYRIPKIKLNQVQDIHLPEFVNRFFDTLTIQKGLPKILIDFSLATFTAVFGLILLALYSAYFLVLAILLGLMIWIFLKLTAKKGLDTSLEESKIKYQMAHWLEEIARVNKAIRLSSQENYHLKRTDKIVKKYLDARQSHFSVLLLQYEYFVVFKVILAAGLLILGSILVFQQEMNIGQFVAAEIVILLIINSVEKIIQTIETIYDVVTGLDKIGQVTDFELEASKGNHEVKQDAGIDVKFENLNFRYRKGDKYILEKFNLHIPNNSIVYLDGEMGSGKSTILQLVSGLLIQTSGEILINNISLSNYKLRSLHNAIGYTFNENMIFLGSILDNITMGLDVDDQYLEYVLEGLKLSSYIGKLPKGIDTILHPEPIVTAQPIFS